MMCTQAAQEDLEVLRLKHTELQKTHRADHTAVKVLFDTVQRERTPQHSCPVVSYLLCLCSAYAMLDRPRGVELCL